MAQPNFIDTASTYPENLGQHNFWNCNLPDYRQRLEEKSEDLFGDEVTAQLEFLQLNGAISGSLREVSVRSSDRELRTGRIRMGKSQNRFWPFATALGLCGQERPAKVSAFVRMVPSFASTQDC